MTTEEVKAVVAEEVKKAMDPVVKQLEALTLETNGGGDTGAAGGTADIPTADVSADTIAKMVGDEIQKAMEPVMKALGPVMKSRALPGNLNDSAGNVKKQEQHYLHGII